MMSEKKNQRLRADLHLHTTNSDGRESPETVIAKAKEAGLSVIAITDHNRFTFTETRQYEDMTILPGIEFSVEYFVPARNDTIEIHVVGIFPNGVHPEDFDGIFANIVAGKEAYVAAILEDLETRGIHITMDEVKRVERTGTYIGRHQIAKILVDRQIEPDMDAAFDHQVGNFSPHYIPSTHYIRYASMEDTVRQILRCGGTPILAHAFGYGMNEPEIEQLICDFRRAAGENAAMEVYYEMYLENREYMEFLERMSEKYGLFASAASDRHKGDQPFASTEISVQWIWDDDGIG